MQKIYAVYYNNGLSYEENQTHVVSMHASLEGAEEKMKELNKSNEFKCMSKEEYYSQDPDEINYPYEEYWSYEYDHWFYYYGGTHYITEYELLP
jgi:hypothetical protein